ncbi:MAG TPA: glycoside hydrolase family 2 TIM barrel-domain containing protein [Lachnospiraceae bacterium]|nr:glycoside hydrolase family 2 TIM barrel-domain containing protein [Lachnospiraceae bacterium]
MRESLYIDGWQFLKTELDTDINTINEYSERFVEVSLPHDWLIADTESFYENSIGWYRKELKVSDIEESCLFFHVGERLYLRFDGVYMDSTLYINGRKAMEWKYGYSAFGLDITDFLTEDTNEILLKVVYQTPNSRWYSGAGIYRNVFLRVLPVCYLPYDGTYVNMKQDGEDFLLTINTEIATTQYGILHGDVQYSLYKDDIEIEDYGVQDTQRETSSGLIIAEKRICVKKPDLWDINTPNLYQLQVKLLQADGSMQDVERISLGFRTFEFTTDHGFFINGKHLKLHGVCEHHDFGCLGAAFSKAALKRKFRILKEMGVNAVRTAHNMPAKEFMDIADEMGILVISEAFDMWERQKTDYDYSRFFTEWAEKDVCSWIRRDRNHPSLLLWSVGNEIYDTHADSHGQEILNRLITYVRKYDPKENASITLGSNYMPWENGQKCADMVEVAGYNYGEECYDEHHKLHHDWIIYGSETASIVQSRGVYHFPYEQSILSDDDEQCSALGNSTTSWGAKSVEKCIADDRDREFCLGQFLWSGFDYIGEPTPYHTKNSYFGQIDTAGFPKDAYYIYKAEWTDAKTAPMVHLFPYWDFNGGQQIDVRVCSNGDMVELFVNGRSHGKKILNHKYGTQFTATYKVPYVPGEIKAYAYDQKGNIIAEECRHSFTDGVKLVAKPDKLVLKGDGSDLCFVEIIVIDANGYPVENAMNYVKVEVNGAAFLAGLDNGDSTDYDSYKGTVRKLFNGKLLAVVQAKKETGLSKIRISGTGLVEAELTIPVEKPDTESGYILPHLETIPCVPCLNSSNMEEQLRKQPVRKIALSSTEGCTLTKSVSETIVEAKIYPETASDHNVSFMAVNDAGIEIDYVKITPIADYPKRIKVKALGNGTFRIRCMSKSGTDKVKIISSLEFLAVGLGAAYLDPYRMIAVGLYTETIGEISNGNEKGFATAREEESCAIFTEIDFGPIGTDEITLPIFALTDASYTFQIWEGRPSSNKERQLLDGVYQKPSMWNTYQQETYRLKRKVKGITDLTFVFHDKVHVKGFVCKKPERAWENVPTGKLI